MKNKLIKIGSIIAVVIVLVTMTVVPTFAASSESLLGRRTFNESIWGGPVDVDLRDESQDTLDDLFELYCIRISPYSYETPLGFITIYGFTPVFEYDGDLFMIVEASLGDAEPTIFLSTDLSYLYGATFDILSVPDDENVVYWVLDNSVAADGSFDQTTNYVVLKAGRYRLNDTLDLSGNYGTEFDVPMYFQIKHFYDDGSYDYVSFEVKTILVLFDSLSYSGDLYFYSEVEGLLVHEDLTVYPYNDDSWGNATCEDWLLFWKLDDGEFLREVYIPEDVIVYDISTSDDGSTTTNFAEWFIANSDYSQKNSSSGGSSSDDYDLGYADGWRDRDNVVDGDYQRGFEEGKTVGYDNGHEIGYDKGLKDGEKIGYDKGFEKGVNSASSDAFGENLLGTTLNAPIDALNQFVLFEVSGVPVTLGGVIGAVIALTLFLLFLKMFH